MKKYRVVGLENTDKNEMDFDKTFHEKYLGRIGEALKHNLKPGVFQYFELLVFERDEQGRLHDANWFHRDDLELVYDDEDNRDDPYDNDEMDSCSGWALDEGETDEAAQLDETDQLDETAQYGIPARFSDDLKSS